MSDNTPRLARGVLLSVLVAHPPLLAEAVEL